MNVFVGYPLSEKWKNKIRELETYGYCFTFYENAFSENVSLNTRLLPLMQNADIILGEPPVKLLASCPKLKWIQLSFAGADKYTTDADFPQTIRLTNASGAFGSCIAEHMMAMLLCMYRTIPDYLKQQKQHIYARTNAERSLSGQTVLILGAGDIGKAFARRIKAFGAYTIGVTRHSKNTASDIDEWAVSSDIDNLLPRADVIACCMPHTKDTEGLLNDVRLRKMKKDASLINVGRGSLIDTDALVHALEDGWFYSVCLDVTSPEPLPSSHPLLSFDRVLLTPHCAGVSFGQSEDVERKIIGIACENLKRFAADEPLLNEVDFTRGY